MLDLPLSLAVDDIAPASKLVRQQYHRSQSTDHPNHRHGADRVSVNQARTLCKHPPRSRRRLLQKVNVEVLRFEEDQVLISSGVAKGDKVAVSSIGLLSGARARFATVSSG